MKNIGLLTIAIITYGILLAGSIMFWSSHIQPWLGQSVDNLAEPSLNAKQPIILLFAGDIMLDRGVEFYITQQNDWKLPFRLIANTLQRADLVFGNLESVISDKGQNVGSIYSFRADPKTLEGLTFAGFDILSVANNHSLDWGMDALRDSISRLRTAGITPVGAGETKAEAYSPTIIEAKGARIGFLAYTAQGSPVWEATETSPGVAWLDETNLQDITQQIALAKEQTDILVVSVHFGEEYQTKPNEIQKLIAKNAIDAGANLVIGHHPHVVQPVEYVCNQVTHICGWIAWSLGNFVFDQGFSKETMEGLLLEVKIAEKQITRVTPRVIRMNSFFQPELLTSQ